MNRRDLLRHGTVVLLLGSQQIARGATIVAVRVWPAPEYSRVTIESDRHLSSTEIVMANPPRLAVDITGIDLNPELRELVAKVKADDPFIEGIRVGQQSPGVVRLVVDLNGLPCRRVYATPVAAYQHRLSSILPAQDRRSIRGADRRAAEGPAGSGSDTGQRPVGGTDRREAPAAQAGGRDCQCRSRTAGSRTAEDRSPHHHRA
jgi:N-acetylmuramoyl-L-alanine amidase